MRPDDILDAIGNVDDALIAAAQEPPKTKPLSKLWIPLASVAACVLLFFILPIVFFSLRGAGSEDGSAPPGDSSEKEQAFIYYVKEDEITSTEMFLPRTAEELFVAWRDLNCIGEDVCLISISYEDGITTITVTEALKNYYDTMDATLLLDTLQMTLRHAFPSEYEDCRLAYE